MADPDQRPLDPDPVPCDALVCLSTCLIYLHICLSIPEPLVADPDRRPLGPDPVPGTPPGYATCLLELPECTDRLL